MASNDPTNKGLIGRRGSTRGGGRLPSLRGPRDLTLGGVQKKTFTPNIPVRPKDRKDEATDNTISSGRGTKSSNERGRGRGGRGRGDRGRGRGRTEREVIQSHSIFEQGPAGDNIKSRSNWGSGGGDSLERASTSRTGTSIKKEKKDPDETKRILDDLLRDDFIDESSFHPDDRNLIPIKLPIGEDVKNEIKGEAKPVKDEVKEEENETQCLNKSKSRIFRPKSAAELFLSDNNSGKELVLIQLPDTLPGEPPEKEDVKDKKPVIKDDVITNPEIEMAKKLNLASIDQFSEGYVGKIRVYKSGKTKLVMGNVELDVNLGTACGFLQDAVSIKLNEDQQNGDMMVLGHVTNKLVCVPDFEQMMEQIAK